MKNINETKYRIPASSRPEADSTRSLEVSISDALDALISDQNPDGHWHGVTILTASCLEQPFIS